MISAIAPQSSFLIIDIYHLKRKLASRYAGKKWLLQCSSNRMTNHCMDCLSVCYLFAMFVPSVKWMEVNIALGASEGLEIPLARPSEAALRLMRRRIK